MRIPTFHQFQQQSALISKQFDDMNKLMLQASTGHRIQASSEDPVLANQIKSHEDFISGIDNYYNNGVLAQNRSSLFSSSMHGSIDVLTEINTLVSKAQSGAVNDKDRISIAEQLEGTMTRLLAYANTADVDGNYIYSGFNSKTTPYVLNGGTYQYNGGYTRAYIDTSSNTNTVFYESGFKIFGDVFNGNGDFTISANSANAGDAASSPGSVIDRANYVSDTYTLTFVTNSAGQLAYQIVGATSGQVIPPPPATIPNDAPAYTTKGDITFNGINFQIDGTPQGGDVFTIAPSTQKNVFNTLKGVIDTLKQPITNQGLFNQTMSQLSASLEQISQHLTSNLSEVGARANAVENQVRTNKSIRDNYEITLSGLRDADVAQVYAALAQKSTALEATKASYLKLQETLMQLLQL